MNPGPSTSTPTLAVRLLAAPLPEIHVGAAAARLRADVDLDVAVLDLKEAVADHMRDGERVVDGRALPAVHALVMAVVEVVEGRDEASHPARFAQLVHFLRDEQGLVR